MAAEGYRARTDRVGGVDVVELEGPDGAHATVVPSVGSQLLSLRLSPEPGSAAVELLMGPPSGEPLRLGVQSGAPILFPWPGRIARSEFTYRGQVYRIPGSGGRHALHGFVFGAPWRVVDWGADDGGTWVRTRIASSDLHLPGDAYPGRWILEVVHRLEPEGYRHRVRVENVGFEPFPFGYGWHPYFRAPLAAPGTRGACIVRVPARARWELTAALLPTGRRLEVSGPYDLRTGSRLADKSYDDPFTLLEREPDGASAAELIDPQAHLMVRVRASRDFEHWVVYSPRTMPGVCLEPYTCVPDAVNLAARGVPTGLRELEPDQSWEAEVTVCLARWSGA